MLIATLSACSQPDTDQSDSSEFTALGNEPFWSLEISPAKKQVILKDMSIEQTFAFNYEPAEKSANTYFYELSSDNGGTVKITIRQEPCSDGMSDRRYLYSSEVVIDGRTLKGCAIKKGEKIL